MLPCVEAWKVFMIRIVKIYLSGDALHLNQRWKECKKIRRASKIVITSASVLYNTPACLENINRTSPLVLRRTPPMPVSPDFPIAAPFALNFMTPRGKTEKPTFHPQTTTLKWSTSQLWIISPIARVSNSLLNESHLANFRRDTMDKLIIWSRPLEKSTVSLIWHQPENGEGNKTEDITTT